ncbi:hypothetical protein GA0115255_110709 [Streptomyces sp. Ncost-T6T-2b]|nr:hypothetical protein GA0115255_110709 [Streptomyces sp. Ncost-T6T-2b]
MSLRAIRTTAAKSPTSASGPAKRATNASSATSSTGSTAPSSASDAPTPISAEKHICTAKPPSSIPGTDIHTCLRAAARCSSNAASRGGYPSVVRPKARSTGWFRANSSTRPEASTPAASSISSIRFSSRTETRAASRISGEQTRAASPSRQSRKTITTTTVAGVSTPVTSGCSRCAQLPAIDSTDFVPIRVSRPTVVPSNHPSGSAATWSPSRWCSVVRMTSATRNPSMACT